MVMEPQLQELSGESFKHKSANKDEEARSDLQIRGFFFENDKNKKKKKIVTPFGLAGRIVT